MCVNLPFPFFLLQNLQRFLKSQSQEPQPPWTWAGHRQSGVWTSTLSTCTETASRCKTAVIWQIILSGHSFLTWYQEWFTWWRWSPTVETWWTKTQCTMQPVSYIMNYKPVHLYRMVCVCMCRKYFDHKLMYSFSCSVPNPPGAITVESQTVNSITFTWPRPVDMNHRQYNFSVSHARGSNRTENNSFLLDNLQSGSPYNITVVTVGVMEYESTAVTTENYTSKCS